MANKHKKSTKEVYLERREKDRKLQRRVSDSVTVFFKNYWAIIPTILCGLIFIFGLNHFQKTMTEHNSEILKLEKESKNLGDELDLLKKGQDESVVQKVIQTKRDNSFKAGKTVADGVRALGIAYNKNTKDEYNLDEQREINEAIAEYVDNQYMYAIQMNPWVKTKDWTIEYEGNVSYMLSQSDVLFTMRDSNNVLMGVVKAKYDDDRQKFYDFEIAYTIDGQKVDSGRDWDGSESLEGLEGDRKVYGERD